MTERQIIFYHSNIYVIFVGEHEIKTSFYLELIDKFRIFAAEIKNSSINPESKARIMIKRLLNLQTITKITLILTTLLLLPSVAMADEDLGEYGLKVGGVIVTSENASDIFNDEKVSFTPATNDNSNNILTLNGAEISAEDAPVIVSNLQNLVIKLKGTRNRLECGSDYSIIYSTNANGFLSITDDNSGDAASLILATKGTMSVVSGFAGMACTLTAYVTNSDFQPIKEMANVAYDTGNKVLKANGSNILSVLYSNQPISYGLSVAGTAVTSTNASNIIASGDNNGKVSFDPETNTLTLNGAQLIEGDISSDIDALIIHLTGNNDLGSIEGGGSLTFEGDDNATLSLYNSDGVMRGFSSVKFGSYHLLSHSTPGIHWDSEKHTLTGVSGDNAGEVMLTQETVYPIWVFDQKGDWPYKQITADNANEIEAYDFTTISYNHNSNTLTLKNIDVNYGGGFFVYVGNGITQLNVCLLGDNHLNNQTSDPDTDCPIFKIAGSTTLNFTTSTLLPGSLEIKTDPDIAIATSTPTFNDILSLKTSGTSDAPVYTISQDNSNLDIRTFHNSNDPDGAGNYGASQYIESGYKKYFNNDDKGKDWFFYWYQIMTSSPQPQYLKIISTENNDNACFTELDAPSLVSKITLLTDMLGATSNNIKVKVQEISIVDGTVTLGKDLSDWAYMSDANSDGILEIPLNKTATTSNIRLYFSSTNTNEFSFALLSVGFKTEESLGIRFGEITVSELNKNDVFGDGTVSYDSDKNTLTLKDAHLTPEDNTDYPGFFYSGNKPLNVKLEGDNSMSNAVFAYDNETNPDPQIRFYTEANKPGSLVMVNNQLNNSSSDFTDVKDYFVGSYSVVYDNTYYSYSSYQSFGGDFYTGTYTISTLRPVISSNYSEGNTTVNISAPSDQTSDATIKYSITYADGSDGITNETYSAPFIVNKAATITSYLVVDGKNSSTTTAYRFLPTPNSIKLTYGAEEPTYTYTPQILPVVEGIQTDMIALSDYFGSMDGEVFYAHCVGKGTGTINLRAPDIHDYVILNDTIGFTVEILPEKPTFSLADNKTYNDSQTITLTSPFSGVEELCEDVSIKYYLGDTEPETVLTYTGPITIDSSTKLTAWVEAVVNSGAPQAETFKSEKVTKEYSIVRSIADATVTLENGTEFTYNESKNVPTIESVILTIGTSTPDKPAPTISLTAETDYTVSYTKGGEAIEADSIINVGTYKMVLTGKGNFTGTKEVEFTISPRAIESMTFSLSATDFTYNAQAQKPTVTLQFDNGGTAKTIPTTNYDVTYSGDCINVGSYSVSATLKGNYSGSADGPSFTISQATISAVTLEKTQLSWTGEEQTVGVASVKAGDLDVPSSDYTVSGNKGKEPGTYTVTVTANDTEGNNFKGSATATFTIDGGYLLWVGSTLVSESNKDDILGDGEKGDDGDYTKVPSFMYNPEENTLLVINSDAGMAIESRLPKLAIHLTGDNKLKKVFFNNQGNTANTGTLLFTCDSNFPGTASIENTKGESAITGFESIDYEFDLQPIAPVKAKYTNGQITDSLGIVADTLTVGTPLAPLTGDEPETLNPDDFTQTNPDGSTASIDLSGATVNNIYYTLPETTDGQGYDPENNTISIVETMTDDDVEQIAQKTMDKTTTVGSNEYAENFVGLTFIVQGGEGIIKIIQEVTDGYEFHLKIGDRPSITVGEGQTGIATIEVPYELTDATYCWLYLVKKVAASRWFNTRVGKRDRATGNLHGVSVQPKNVASSKSASKASGGNISKTANDAITGIVEINNDTPSSNSTVEKTNDRWYTIDGRRIDKPTQKGLYIRNRKKIVIK